MKQRYVILIGLIFGLSCQHSEPILVQTIIGDFYSPENSTDYSHLELRKDHTYHFDQAINHSCDIWRHFYGAWEVEGDRIVLFDGVDLDSLINVTSNKDLEADTLEITFSKSFLDEFPNLEVRIGLLGDIPINDNRIIFSKYAYCEKQDLFRPSRDKASTYQFYPLELNIRAGNYYYIEHYILNKSKIHFDIEDFKVAAGRKKKLMEYELKNGILKSTYCSKRVNEHELVRGNEE